MRAGPVSVTSSISWDKIGATVLSCLLVTLMLFLMAGPHWHDLSKGLLVDTDGYMHALRQQLLMQGKPFSFVARDNAPYGFVMHWTAPYDVYTVGLVKLFGLFVDPETAFH